MVPISVTESPLNRTTCISRCCCAILQVTVQPWP